jgi:hypothetical protein
MGEDGYQRYLKTFNEPISVVIDSTTLDEDSGMTGEMYIYVYRINQYNIRKFTLINCPPKVKKQYAYNLIPESKKVNGLQTKLNREKKQVVIYYSTNPPAEIKYYMNDAVTKTKTIMGPRCSVKPKPFNKKDLYDGREIKNQRHFINTLLRYREFHFDKNTNELSIHIYYNSVVSAETFTVTPAWMREYFNPAKSTNEIVTIPLTEVPTKIIFSAYTDRATEIALKWDPHDDYRDTDFFYFKMK